MTASTLHLIPRQNPTFLAHGLTCSARRTSPPPHISSILKHPAFPTATWCLEPEQSGLVPVAADRGGPFRVSYEVHGTGPIHLVLIMGLGSLKSAWQRQTLYFGHTRCDRHSVLIIDNRGMGASDKPNLRYSTSEMAMDVIEVLTHVGWLNSDPDQQQKRTLHVAGVSMGGMIAQELACLVPHAISSLSLLCTAAAIENTTSFTENMANRVSMLVPKSLDRSVRDSAKQLFPPSWLAAPDEVELPDPNSTPMVRPPSQGGHKYLKFETNYQRFAAGELHKRMDAQAFGTKGFILQLIAAGWHHKSPGQLREMADMVGRERIMVMHGEEDKMISVPHGQKLVKYLEPGEVWIEKGMGHAPPVERTGWFHAVLERFMERAERLDGRA